MDELREQLTQILNDPERMQQILSLAGSLTAGDEQQERDAQLPLPSAELLSQLQSAVSQMDFGNEKQKALLEALRPYLKPGRTQRLQRAIQIAKLSRAAGAALRSVSAGAEQGGDQTV